MSEVKLEAQDLNRQANEIASRHMESSPNYVIKTNEAVLMPVVQSKGFKIMKIGVWIVVIILILGSLLFGDNLFAEMSWSSRMLLIVMVVGVICIGGKQEYVPSPMELQFYDDYLVLYLPKRYLGIFPMRMEITRMNYSEITRCVIKEQSQRVHLYGGGTCIYYNYKADGSLPQNPTKIRKCDSGGLLYFNIQFATDIDFKKEIEMHSPLEVIIENS